MGSESGVFTEQKLLFQQNFGIGRIAKGEKLNENEAGIRAKGSRTTGLVSSAVIWGALGRPNGRTTRPSLAFRRGTGKRQTG